MKVRAYIQNAKARALVFVLILSTIGNVLLPVAPVHAQAVVYDAQAWVQRDFLFRQQEIKQTIAGSLTDASLGALMHAASYFTRKLAYDTALYVAYGGNGQGALAFQDGWGT
ncbi:MAG: hypothetical protein COU35_03685, partial [Candidatus Magasanikbacteria bacterium CG10_big_fil_rev_8_21_14_0_10_47_10]